MWAETKPILTNTFKTRSEFHLDFSGTPYAKRSKYNLYSDRIDRTTSPGTGKPVGWLQNIG